MSEDTRRSHIIIKGTQKIQLSMKFITIKIILNL